MPASERERLALSAPVSGRARAWTRAAGWWRTLVEAGRRRWEAGESPASGPVWPPPAAGPAQEPELMPVRVTREVVELVGTPEQLARSGLTGPGGDAIDTQAAGGGPTGQGGLVMGAVMIAAAIESWLVWLLHKVLLAGALHPRAVLWVAVLLWLYGVTS